MHNTNKIMIFTISVSKQLLISILNCGDGNGNAHQYSSLENPMDGGVWWLQSMGSQDLDMT